MLTTTDEKVTAFKNTKLTENSALKFKFHYLHILTMGD